MRLADMMNLGPATEEYLRAVGIETPEQLSEIGSVDAYRRLKERFPRQVNLLFLYAMEGALLDIHWNALPPEVKDEIVSAVT